MQSSMNFHWLPQTRLLFGCGTVRQVGEIAQEFGGRHALVVTDAGIVAAGHLARVTESLSAVGIAVAVFDGVRENPTTEDVDACVLAARVAKADILIGLGGGSSIDAAKGANFLLTNGGNLRDYWKAGNPEGITPALPFLPLIAIPTTAGTGSEVQSHALISDARTHGKMAIGDRKATPRVAILDPDLTLSCPHRVTACTGIDAIVHAVETAVTRRRNPLSLVFSREAFRLLLPGFPRVLEMPDHRAAREAMLLGASFAGMAIENSMLGVAHSLANPLTARFNVVHGQAVGMMLPIVVRFNAEIPEVAEMYRELMVSAGFAGSDASAAEAVVMLIERLEGCREQAGFPNFLEDCGVSADDAPMLAAEAAAQWTAQFNPRSVTKEDCAALYRSAISVTDSGKNSNAGF